MFDDDDMFADQGPPKPLWRRVGVPAGVAIAIVSSGVIAVELMRGSTQAPRPHQDEHITRVMLPPPPPPPPPKPPPPTPEKTVQEKPKEQLSPQKASVPKPMKAPPAPPQALQTSITGPGPGSLQSGNGGSGDCIGQGCGTGPGGGGGDNDGYYSQLIRSQIEAALRRDDKLRYARYSLRVTFRLDGSGHITNAAIGAFTGDDDARAEVNRLLLTISTNDSPPSDITAKVFTVSIRESARG
jgi:hypothetical protein